MRQPNSSDPDRGPSQKHEGMGFDMGYETQTGNEGAYYPDGQMRGNRYVELQNQITSSDAGKIKRSERRKY